MYRLLFGYINKIVALFQTECSMHLDCEQPRKKGPIENLARLSSQSLPSEGAPGCSCLAMTLSSQTNVCANN
jgi:hypothetical protein